MTLTHSQMASIPAHASNAPSQTKNRGYSHKSNKGKKNQIQNRQQLFLGTTETVQLGVNKTWHITYPPLHDLAGGYK
jgi:hypothetical protein